MELRGDGKKDIYGHPKAYVKIIQWKEDYVKWHHLNNKWRNYLEKNNIE